MKDDTRDVTNSSYRLAKCEQRPIQLRYQLHSSKPCSFCFHLVVKMRPSKTKEGKDNSHYISSYARTSTASATSCGMGT